ncbi:hypothetical protein SCLCIDRAFT_306027 [Scleroderma citrinum Foug A]|uniref:Uncharacterized protein n=1 Tax=Scleroderma citrinum Foug A TaxID=1036808 RepID=A0A0C3DG75_9AGAM|nr:hypothetical protein SCLCIDRAFT_306027 [Scleroderma citrinum Foug A]
MIAQHQSSVPFRLHGNWQVLGTEWGQAHFTVASVQNFFSVMFRLQLALRRPSISATCTNQTSPKSMRATCTNGKPIANGDLSIFSIFICLSSSAPRGPVSWNNVNVS